MLHVDYGLDGGGVDSRGGTFREDGEVSRVRTAAVEEGVGAENGR